MSKLIEPKLDPIIDGSVSAEEAISASQRELSVQGADVRWCLPWAFALWQKGEYNDSFDVLSPYYSSLQDDVDYLQLYGMVARQLPDQLLAAESAFRSAIKLSPNRGDTYYNLGNLLFAQERFDEANQVYIRSLALNPYWALGWLNLGISARSTEQLLLSQISLRNCIKLDPSNIRAWCNYGITCHQLEQFDLATSAYMMALSHDKEDGPSLVNLAVNLNASNRHSEAADYFQAASSLTLQEDCGDALFNLALTRLILGEFEEGWKLYECRFKTRQFDCYHHIPSGEWIHSRQRLDQLASANKEVVVWSEQGLGDSIQFIRYIYLLREMGIRPVVATRSLLVRLFTEWLDPKFPILDDRKVDLSSDKRPHLSMMSLPYLMRTTLLSIPSHIPYLHPPGPPPTRLFVPEPPGALSIGLVWATNPDNKLMYKRKSMQLSALMEPLLPALREDLISIHSLQVGSDSQSLIPYCSEYNNIFDWNGRLSDFADTAHVISQLDLVICVDTAVAHLSSALGVKTWLLLHYDADFRWMRGCVDSPWYSSMTLFRQTRYGCWSSVVRQVLDELGRIYGLKLEFL